MMNARICQVLALLMFVSTATPAPAQKRSKPGASRAKVRVVDAVFSREVDENDASVDVTSKFRSDDVIYLRVDLNSKPENGELSCTFYLGKDEITTTFVDMETLKDVKEEGNAYAIFSLSNTSDGWPPSSDYWAEVRFEGESIGTFEFSVLPDSKKKPVTISNAADHSSEEQGNSATHDAARAKETKAIVQTLLEGTALIEGFSENGNEWFGTAWVVDREKRLLVTNDHVANAAVHDDSIDRVTRLQVYFPDYRNGRVIHDVSHYARNVEPIPVKVIYGNEKTDLALIQAERLPDESNIKQLEIAERSADLGDPIYSIGGIPAGSEGLWIYTTGVVRAVYRRTLATGFKARTLEADMQTNKGNSGGPVVNSRGELVAVVEGHRTDARSVSLYIDVEEVHSFIEEAMPLVSPKTAEQFTKRGRRHYQAGRYDLAQSDFSRALRMNPDDAFAMACRAWVYYKQEDYRTARSEFDDAIRSNRSILYAYHGRAMVSFAEGDYDSAIEDLTHAIRNATEDEELAQYYNQRGVAYSRLSETDDALEDFDRAIEADPRNDWALANRGNMLIDLGDYDPAIESIKSAIEVNDTEPDFFAWIGRANHQMGNHENALRFYGAAAEMDPSNAEYLIEKGKCLIEVSRLGDAADSFLAAIAIDEESDYIRNEVGSALFEAAKYSLAYEQFRIASELNPDDLAYWYNRGLSAYRFRDFTTALKDLNEAATIADDADVFAFRGNAYSMLGRPDQAKADFAAARELDSAYRRYTTKYIRIKNETGEPLKVWVRYWTKGTDGVARWYPTKSDGLWAEWKPGEVSGLLDGKQEIHGVKFRVWAEGLNSGRVYDTFYQNDLVAAGSAGYLTAEGKPEKETYTFVVPQDEQE